MRARHLPCRIVTVLLLAGAMLPPAAARDIQVPDPFAQPAAPPAAPRVIILPGPPPAGANAAVSVPADLLAKARADDVDAQVKLGIFYARAKPPNYQEALKWFRQASDRGSAAGAANVGQIYAAGDGVAKDPSEAAKWYRLGADRGDGTAQTKLGQLYEQGLGMPQDFAEAVKWYRAAADQKNAAGLTSLGSMYVRGRGVAADQAEATRLFRLAADQGWALAQANLGMQYLAGRGTAQNNSAGYFWLDLAAAKLSPDMKVLRDKVAHARDDAAAKLAPLELARVQRLAAAWKPGGAEVPAD